MNQPKSSSLQSGIALKVFGVILLTAFVVYPQNTPESEVQSSIRKEGLERSQIMRTLHFLTDVYGPRLTGSPNLKAAGEWAIKQMQSWELENGHLEPWDFGHTGWLNERAAGHVLSPFKEPLVFETLAWTPSTNGAITGQAYHLVPPDSPTEDDLKAFLESQKEKVKGKMVLVGKHILIPVSFDPQNKRTEDARAKEMYSGNAPAGPPVGFRQQQQQAPQPGQARKLSGREVNQRVGEWLAQNGALLMLTDTAVEGRMEQRRVRAFNNRNFDPDKFPPAVVLSNEDYGRITRVMADGAPVELEFNIVNRLYPEGKTAYNTVAEIPGSDKKDEVIMLGGHLDSWHSATGATDNAIGCTIMMEAARILKAIGVKPRRTIRVALWSGEEQGLLGSQAYVKEHFGSVENPKPDFAKFGGYFNIDSGTGRPRGFGVFGPPEAAEVLHKALTGFEDLGFYGARASGSRSLGGSDNTSFSNAGLPGIGAQQDPIEYFNITWHTNQDTYERIVEDDVKKAAVVIAAAVYHLAMRDELLPRFSKEQMPPVPASRN
ncbi:MAG: M20/M25/M40 family metallo-hydrolase [Acidobacteria bacterium]|nr:M20/M25/M40 family metallo-hydrolase [Acidobacteriota bacterium]MBI3422691.1 M20/M25/M40 family metallo-hydrolase [Acidobacteriota bacterium]